MSELQCFIRATQEALVNGHARESSFHFVPYAATDKRRWGQTN